MNRVVIWLNRALKRLRAFKWGKLSVGVFAQTAYVDATAMSKGKGFQGVMKLHNYSGGPASHGSGFHRHAGSWYEK